MTTLSQTSDIAARVVRRIGTGTSGPTRSTGARRDANSASMTCAWVTTDDGSEVMQWTEPEPVVVRAQLTKAAP
jgi:hypothetical protein